jgi:carboxyl-terminal processing protease
MQMHIEQSKDEQDKGKKRISVFGAVSWIVLNMILGIVGGIILSFGPLAWSIPLVIVCALLGGLGGWFISRWSHRRGYKRLVLAVYIVMILLIVLLSIVPLYRIGLVGLPQDSPKNNFKRLMLALESAYPYTQKKGIDLQEIQRRYTQELELVTNDHDYWRLVSRMLTEFQDSHTGLLSPSVSSGRYTFATCLEVDGQMVVDTVGTVAKEIGLRRGDIVLQIQGMDVEDAIQLIPPVLTTGSTARLRRAKAVKHILSTTGDAISIQVSTANGIVEYFLKKPEALEAIRDDSVSPAPVITGELLDSGFGLIRIPEFYGEDGQDLVGEFDMVLDDLLEAPGIILDLRGNGGGSTFISDRIAGRFLDEDFAYGTEYFQQRLITRGWRLSYDYLVKSRSSTYFGPLILLTDVGCMSTTENFIVALIDSGRATAVGRQTGGSSGNPVRFMLTNGAFARFSTGDFRRSNGESIEGLGIVPHLPVSWTVEDVRSGNDPDLEAAIEFLLAGKS